MPDILAVRDGGREVLRIGQFGKLPVAVDGQPRKAKAATTVEPIAKSLACRLFIDGPQRQALMPVQ